MHRPITTEHHTRASRLSQWLKVRDALEGEDKIKSAGTSYLPKPEGMAQYDAYKERASYYAVAERTLRGMTGAILRHAPIIELPAVLTQYRESVTSSGDSLDLLIEQTLTEVLSIGRSGLLLDFPTEGATSQTLPYIASYHAEDIIDWDEQLIAGERVLTRLVLREDVDNDGDDEYLELTLDPTYRARRYRVTDGAEVVIMESSPTVLGAPMQRIPFVFVNPYDLRSTVEKPPFLDLVNLNLAHYRNSADYEHALFMTAQPTAWIAGNLDVANRPSSIGSGTIWYLPEGTQVGMLEFNGAGVGAQRQAMEDKENRMATLGARMISEGRNRNEASDTARMRGRGEFALLMSAVSMTEQAILKLLRLAADWTRASRDEVSVKINRDVVETRLGAQDMTALVKAWQSGAISQSTLHTNLQRGEIMSPDRSSDDERDLISEEGGDLSLITSVA